MSIRILGGAQTDFAQRAETSTQGLADLMRTAVLGALDDAELGPDQVDAAHVGNLAAELFTGQAHLGGLLAAVVPELAGRPITRHEAACASGSVALLSAIAALEAGHCDTAVVVGVEVMRGVSPVEAAQHLGSAAWVGQETDGLQFPWPELFADIAQTYADRYGLDHAHLGRIAELNHENARRNPRAQSRDWDFGPGAFDADDEVNPVVSGALRKTDCGRITDGAAAVVLARDDALPRPQAPFIGGWGLRTDSLRLADKLERRDEDGYVFPHLRAAVADALSRAGVGAVSDLDVVELHDCFTITEYALLEHIGLAPPGQAWKVIEDGTIAPGGALPVNPSGGLIGGGHPVGATGVRMLVDVARQVAGRADEMQVPGARRGLTVNIGGSCTTSAAFVVEGGAR